MNEQQIIKELSKRMDYMLVEALFKEFRNLKKAFWNRDKVNVGIYGGRFSEICIACIFNLYTQQKIDMNKIYFDVSINAVINFPKNTPEDDVLTLNIPLALRSIYTLRNKKKIAHIKTFDPNYFDITYIHDTITWVLSQIVLTLILIDEKILYQTINSMMEKQLPVVQEFEDNSIMVLDKNATFNDEILIALYRSSVRLKNDELQKVLNPEYPSKITTYLKLLNKQKMVHINKDGSMITNLGLKYIETKFPICF
jgi:hypothetical protein